MSEYDREASVRGGHDPKTGRLATGKNMSVFSSVWNDSSPIRRIFMNFYMGRFLKNLGRETKFHEHLTRMTDTIREVLCPFMIISR